MFAVTAAATVALSTAGWAQNPQAVLSWGNTCPTFIKDMTFSAAGPYQMYIVAKNLTAADANVGYDINLFVGRVIPDAWRFDDPGCQTALGAVIGATHTAVNGSCPKGVGLASSDVVGAQLYTNESPNDRLNIRLIVTSNNFTPVAGTTYTIWNLSFDHTASVTGPTTAGSCGGAGQPLCIAMTDQSMPGYDSVASGVLTVAGAQVPFSFANPTDSYVTWNGGSNCPGAVPTQSATWGKLKSLYH